MIKLSVVISNYNSNKILPNTFVSLSRQKTDFDFEVCFLDDCSEENPKALYDEFLLVKNKKGIRLKQHIGDLAISSNFLHHKIIPSNAMALEMTSIESEIIVLMLSDILLVDEFALQKFHDRMKEKVIQTPRIYTCNVSSDLYLNFEENIKTLNCTLGLLYQDTIPPRPYQYPVLMPFYRKTLERVGYMHNTHEIDLTNRFKELGYIMEESDVVAVHQAHAPRPSVKCLCDDNLINWNSNCPERIIL